MAEKTQSHVHLPNWEGGGGYMVEKDNPHGTARRSQELIGTQALGPVETRPRADQRALSRGYL